MNTPKFISRPVFLLFTLFLGIGALPATADVVQLLPRHKSERVLAPSLPSDNAHYLAFSSVLDLGDRVLVSFKRGHSHANDPGARIDMLTIDKATDRVAVGRPIAKLDDKIMEMGEWVRFPGGVIGNYIDAQQGGAKPGRIGIRFTLSSDGGHTFGPLQRLGLIDDVEYGYPFDFVVEGQTTWMLAMTFSNLQGGRSVTALRPAAGSVDVIRSDNSGRTWSRIRNLTQEFGDIPINESSFVRCGDGWLVATRGYDDTARLHLTDHAFHVLQEKNLTATYSFIEGYIGRPRLFVRDGRFYLIGRNWTTAKSAVKPSLGAQGPGFPAAMKLCLFRIDPDSLAVETYAILDNADAGNVTDGYYPVPYFCTHDGQTWLRVVTYKGMNHQPPQIVEFEFLWEEVR